MPTVTRLAGWAMLAPSLAFSFIAGIFSMPVVSQIRAQSESWWNNGHLAPYTDLLTPAWGFLAFLAAGEVCLFVTSVATFQALIYVATCCQKPDATCPGALDAFQVGMRQTFFRGLLITFGIVLMLAIDYFLFGGLPILSMFSLVAYVLSMAEGRGAFSSLKKSLMFRYTSPATGGAFAVGLILVAIGLVSSLFIQSIGLMAYWLQRADEWVTLPGILRQPLFEFFPLSILQLVPHFLTHVAISAYAVLLSFILVSLFNQSSRTPTRLMTSLS